MDDRVNKTLFGLVEGEAVSLYSLSTRSNLSVRVSTLGATIEAIYAPDRIGNVEDVVIGFDTLEERIKFGPNRMGVTVGRVGNRIKDSCYVDPMTGEKIVLASSFPPHKHHLHGGPKGYWNRVWKPSLDESGSEFIVEPNAVGFRLELDSPDGDMGYPGNVRVKATFMLKEEGELCIDYEASTDRLTPIMLTNHAFFNLSGNGKRDVTSSELFLKSSEFPEIDSDLIPTGKIRSVDGTPMDFRTPRRVGGRIREDYDILRYGNGGYDLNFILDRKNDSDVDLVARLRDVENGRVLEVMTNQKCLQVFSGNHLNMTGKKGQRYGKYHGICFEPQGYVNAVNLPDFPSVFVSPGERYHNIIIYKFTEDNTHEALR